MKLAHHTIPFIIALTLLTRLPVWQWLPSSLKNRTWTEQQQGLSVLWYPGVGVLLALLLTAVAIAVAVWPPMLAAALLLTVWVVLTGALHLDGFVDAVDAAYAAHRYGDQKHGHKATIIAIFKDPHSGAMAVVAVILLLLLKFSMLTALLTDTAIASTSLLIPLVIALVAARLSAVIFMMITPYAGSGMALVLTQHFPNKAAIFLSIVCAGFIAVLLPWSHSLILLTVIAVIIILWRRFWLQTIDGFVGDCVGALIEIIEVVVLFLFCLYTLPYATS